MYQITMSNVSLINVGFYYSVVAALVTLYNTARDLQCKCIVWIKIKPIRYLPVPTAA